MIYKTFYIHIIFQLEHSANKLKNTHPDALGHVILFKKYFTKQDAVFVKHAGEQLVLLPALFFFVDLLGEVKTKSFLAKKDLTISLCFVVLLFPL